MWGLCIETNGKKLRSSIEMLAELSRNVEKVDNTGKTKVSDGISLEGGEATWMQA